MKEWFKVGDLVWLRKDHNKIFVVFNIKDPLIIVGDYSNGDIKTLIAFDFECVPEEHHARNSIGLTNSSKYTDNNHKT
jgi:hypothetical protein